MTDAQRPLIASLGGPSDDVEMRIGVAWRELRRGASMQVVRDYFTGDGPDALDLGQQDCLDLVVQHGPLRMGELADALRVDASTATRAVARLEAEGLAERTRSSDDARVIEVEATPLGAEVIERYRDRRLGFLHKVLLGFTKGEQAILAELLERLVDAVDTFVADERCKS